MLILYVNKPRKVFQNTTVLGAILLFTKIPELDTHAGRPASPHSRDMPSESTH